jgi:hypothetical protein
MTIANVETLKADAYLTRGELAQALTASGFPVARGTLAKKASVGGGPTFQKFGRRPVYQWGDALSWARAQLGPRVTCTSELRVA